MQLWQQQGMRTFLEASCTFLEGSAKATVQGAVGTSQDCDGIGSTIRK